MVGVMPVRMEGAQQGIAPIQWRRGWVGECHASPMEGGVVGTVPVGLWVLCLWGAFVPRAGALLVGVGCSASRPLRWEGQWGAVVPCASAHSLHGSVWCCITCFTRGGH